MATLPLDPAAMTGPSVRQGRGIVAINPTITFEVLPGPPETLARPADADDARRFLALAHSELAKVPAVTHIGPTRWRDSGGVMRTGVVWAMDEGSGTSWWFRLGREADDG